jgi:quercetin dioxygenase-like cupin family protein
MTEDIVKKFVIVSGIAAFILFASLGIARAQKDSSNEHATYVAAGKATFAPMEGGGGKVTTAVLWGDPDKGPHSVLTKFAPGYDAGMHSHTADTRIIVIKGAYLYKDEDGEKRVGPGDYLRVPGGHKHWSGGDKNEGALFYMDSSDKFDFIPAK